MVALARPDNLIAFPDVAPQGKSNEWYTPSRYIEAARLVMGSIDLDPASCDVANEIVKAKRYYTQREDGLKQSWHGNIWLNPPYGKINNKSGMLLWVNKLIGEYQSGNVTSAILLVTCDPDTEWFRSLWDYVICFPSHVVHFFKPDAQGNIKKDSRWPQFFGTVFVYLGLNELLFIEIFSQFGRIAKAIDTPKVHPVNLSLWEVQ